MASLLIFEASAIILKVVGDSKIMKICQSKLAEFSENILEDSLKSALALMDGSGNEMPEEKLGGFFETSKKKSLGKVVDQVEIKLHNEDSNNVIDRFRS